MSESDLQFRDPPLAGDEAETLLGILDRGRSYIAWKCGGLGVEEMGRALAPSTMTLGGLVKHLALVEAHSFAYKLRGEDLGAPWDDIDWDADPNWEWRTGATDPPEETFALWRAEVRRADKIIADGIAEGGLDLLSTRAWPDGRVPNLRRLVVDQIEEYSRHVGHADLIRESIDGLTGEDPSN